MGIKEIMETVDRQMEQARMQKRGPRRGGIERRQHDVPVEVDRRTGERRSGQDRRHKGRA